MLYNIEKKKVQALGDCLACKHFDSKRKKCNGLNKTCFEYDSKTKTIIDGITKMPINVGKGE